MVAEPVSSTGFFEDSLVVWLTVRLVVAERVLRKAKNFLAMGATEAGFVVDEVSGA